MKKLLITLLQKLLNLLKPNQPKTKKPYIPQDASEITPDTIITQHPVIEELAIPTKTIKKLENPRFMWCLDNGHGKLTEGKRSPTLMDGSVFFEYQFNRAIVAQLMIAFKERNIQYYNVVPEVEIGNFLKGRVKRANQLESDLPKIFLSVHANAGPGEWTTAHGIETWANHHCKDSQWLAGVFQSALVRALGWTNRGVKTQETKQFYVLRKTEMEAVLLELGFYNNRTEVLHLLNPAIQQEMVSAIVEAVLFIEAKYKL